MPTPPTPPTPPAPPAESLLFRMMPDLEGGFSVSFGGARLGISPLPLSDQLAAHYGVSHGVLVGEVEEDSAAARAGIKAGDIITKIGSEAVENAADIRRALADIDKDAEVSIELKRDGKAQTLKVKIEAPERRTIRRVI